MHSKVSISAAILAGGKSRRLSYDKAFLKWGSATLIERLISILQQRFSEITIVANDGEKYSKFCPAVKSDIFPGNGPLGGIYTALVTSSSFYNFVFACDLPFVNCDLIDCISSKAGEADVVIPRWKGRFEPLCAIYSKNCIEPIKTQLEKNDLKISNFFPQVKIEIIEEKELEKLNLKTDPFLNINTKQDCLQIRDLNEA